MKLMEFAETMPEEFDEKVFIDRVNQVIDLKAIQALGNHERQALHDFAQYLSDYMLYLKEYSEGEGEKRDGASIIEYRGPLIKTSLTRPGGSLLDTSILDNFGLGAADARFGE